MVRQRIQDGKKNFSDNQGEVTIIFIDIEYFDQLVQQYSGKELIDLLDKVYNAFDSLCEQHGLQKIETVGKTYMACGGLKVCEKDIDSRLLGSHHSVRITDFAFNAQNYVNTQILRNGKKLSIKIGIHTGDVISGVVGETKPQFSLIGPTVNKTARVCSKCTPTKILISKETHKALEANSTNFIFKQEDVFMKGIGNEAVFTVTKRKTFTTKMILKRNNHQSMIRMQQKNRKIDDYKNAAKNKDIAKNDRNNYNRFDEENGLMDQQNGLETFRSITDEANPPTSER